MDQKQIVRHLLTKADKYRQFAHRIGDHETVRRILALTEELKQRARALAKPEEAKIRIRAREIWEENGRPAGFGSRPNVNFGKLRISQNETARMFNLV